MLEDIKESIILNKPRSSVFDSEETHKLISDSKASRIQDKSHI